MVIFDYAKVRGLGLYSDVDRQWMKRPNRVSGRRNVSHQKRWQAFTQKYYNGIFIFDLLLILN